MNHKIRDNEWMVWFSKKATFSATYLPYPQLFMRQKIIPSSLEIKFAILAQINPGASSHQDTTAVVMKADKFVELADMAFVLYSFKPRPLQNTRQTDPAALFPNLPY